MTKYVHKDRGYVAKVIVDLGDTIMFSWRDNKANPVETGVTTVSKVYFVDNYKQLKGAQ